LAQYGPEAFPIRQQMREAIGPFVDRLWREQTSNTTAPFQAAAAFGAKEL
jgi:hypothetical protein